MTDYDLFGAIPPGDSGLPPGMRLEEDFLAPDEEQALLAHIRGLPLTNAEYLQYTARRRTMSYGGKYDFAHQQLDEAPPIPDWLQPLKARAAAWAEVNADEIAQALVSEYAPGTPLGWHRDVPHYEHIIGISLAGEGVMRFRRYPPRREDGRPARADLKRVLRPRSIYTLQGESRWRWQHAVSPTKVLRFSITFRTRSDREVQGTVYPVGSAP